jgi:hypothetical protein
MQQVRDATLGLCTCKQLLSMRLLHPSCLMLRKNEPQPQEDDAAGARVEGADTGRCPAVATTAVWDCCSCRHLLLVHTHALQLVSRS